MVAAVPPPTVVERDYKQVAPIQSYRKGSTPGVLGHGVTQPALQPVEHRCPQQEVSDVVGLTLKHLLDDVLHDLPVPPVKPARSSDASPAASHSASSSVVFPNPAEAET